MQDDRGLGAGGVHLAGNDLVPHLHGHGHIPLGVGVKAGDVAAAGDEGAALLFEGGQRPLDAVVDIAQDAGAQGNAQGAAGGGHRLAGRKAAGLLVDLNGGELLIHTDDFAHQMVVADMDHFHHGKASLAFDGDHRAVDAVNEILSQFGSPRF